MNHIETYKGIKIYSDPKDKKNPIISVQENIPVLGVLQTAHKNIMDAKKFIDQITKK